MIASWLTKVAVVTAIVGVVLFDAGAVVVNYLDLDSAAHDIALALSSDLAGQPPPAASDLEARAVELARPEGARVLRADIDARRTIHIRLTRTARTILVRRIDALKSFGRAVAGARATLD